MLKSCGCWGEGTALGSEIGKQVECDNMGRWAAVWQAVAEWWAWQRGVAGPRVQSRAATR